MKLKALALALFLFSTQYDASVNANSETERHTRMEQIVARHLEDLLVQMDIDDNSRYLHTKYKLKGKYDKETRQNIRELAQRLELEEEWIYKLFALESRGNPQAVNKASKATGLIQFMPFTAKGLGTSVEDLVEMNVSEQLIYVEKYILRVKRDRTFTQFLDLYLAVFYPNAINKPMSYEIGSEISISRAKSIFKQNKGIDNRGNKDGVLTKEDLYAWVS